MHFKQSADRQKDHALLKDSRGGVTMKKVQTYVN